MNAAISGPDDELGGELERTAMANAVMARVGQPSGDSTFLHETERIVRDGTEW